MDGQKSFIQGLLKELPEADKLRPEDLSSSTAKPTSELWQRALRSRGPCWRPGSDGQCWRVIL